MDMFESQRSEQMSREAPLAARLRPDTLDAFVGQEHLVGEGHVIRQAIETGQIPSIILWGPPGSGKTTLSSVIANTTESHFSSVSALGSAGDFTSRRLYFLSMRYTASTRPSRMLCCPSSRTVPLR